MSETAAGLKIGAALYWFCGGCSTACCGPPVRSASTIRRAVRCVSVDHPGRRKKSALPGSASNAADRSLAFAISASVGVEGDVGDADRTW